MPKTIFYDLSKGGYRKMVEYPYDIECRIGELIDFTQHFHYDDDMYEVVQVIHLPKESSKIIELKLRIRTPD
jgi:hypothetical protein